MKCIICSQEKKMSVEHIIPHALGNCKFTTSNVCEDCNNKLGAYVDKYLTDNFIVKIIRKELLKSETNLFPSTAFDNGVKYIFSNDIPQLAPSIDLKNGVLSISAENQEKALSMAKTKLKKMKYTDAMIENCLKTASSKEVYSSPPTFKFDFELERLLLSAVKIAYEYAIDLLGDRYLNDNIAIIFRNHLYKAITSKGKNDLSQLSKYVTTIQKSSKEIKESMLPTVNKLVPPARHICLIHYTLDNKLVCDIYLFLEDETSFTVLVSDDAFQYNMQDKVGIAVVLENENLIKL